MDEFALSLKGRAFENDGNILEMDFDDEEALHEYVQNMKDVEKEINSKYKEE